MGLAIVMALAGMGLGYVLYRNAYATADALDPLERMMPGVFRALNNRLYFDEIYASVFGRLLRWRGAGVALVRQAGARRLDQRHRPVDDVLGAGQLYHDDVVLNDGVDALSDGTNAVGDTARKVETGKIQDYGALIFMGVVVLGVIYLYGFGR